MTADHQSGTDASEYTLAKKPRSKPAEITTEIGVGIPFVPAMGIVQHSPVATAVALWDTGSQSSCISEKCARSLGLRPVKNAVIHDINGISQKPVYLVNIILPNQTVIPCVEVVEIVVTSGPEVILGMDVIMQGNFSVSNFNGSPVFSFGLPSELSIGLEG